MNALFKTLPKSELLLTIEVDQKTLDVYENEAARVISERVEIPGFRKGQAPKAFVISHMGPDAFFQEVLSVALPRSYFEAIKEKDLKVISRPEIKVLSKSPLKYEAKVAIMPEITLKGYEKMKMKGEPIEITEKEVDGVIEEMRKYRANYKPLNREVKKGDRVEIDFQGKDEGGAPIDSTKSQNHPLFVGEGTLIPGFEENLVGMRIGEKKKFVVKFPKDFQHEPLRNKNVHFETEVKKGEEAILPEVNEDFVAELMGEKKTVPEFKEALKKDLHARKKIDERRSRENLLLEKFLKEAKFDVPPVLMEEETDYMMEDLKREIEARKLSFETYMERMKKEKRDVRGEFLPEAEKRIRIRLILNFLFGALKITVGDDEMKLASEKLLERANDSERKSVKDQIDRKGEVYLRLKNNLMLEKLFAYYLD